MKNRTVGELTQVLKKCIALKGELQVQHAFKDGSTLVAELMPTSKGKVNKRFFKVTDMEIKIGNFYRGKFHYNPKTQIQFTKELITL